MRIAKIVLTVLIIAVALVAAAVALFWEQLLTPEQKMQYGFQFSALEDYAARARRHPDNIEILSDYAEALAVCGNLGRSRYLCDLYGAHSATLDQLRSVIEEGLKAASRDEVYAAHDAEAARAAADLPVGQALRYLEGYRYALAGDWASARNNFAAIDQRRLAPMLRPYWRYYLGRSYRLAGDDDERSQLEELFGDVASMEEFPQLAARAHYNLIGWYLSEDYGGPDGFAAANTHLVALESLPAGWPLQKAHTDFAEYLMGQGDYAQAWVHVQGGLQIDPRAAAGQRCGELAVELLGQLLDEQGAWGMDGRGAITLPLNDGVFIDLADCAAQHGFSAHATALLDRLKPHLANNHRSSWEELRVGMARCYRAGHDRAALRDLMADANLRDLSDARLGEIYFQYAQLLQEEQAWNSALDYYRSAAKLSRERAGESLFQCYAILKHVQDPLNLDKAEQFLLQVVQQYPTSDAMPKAVEELLPLMVFRGEQPAARELIRWLEERVPPNGDRTAEQQRTAEQLLEVLTFWRVQLLERSGNTAAARVAAEQMPCKYWNYYELMTAYPPMPQLSSLPGALETEESAGEYLVGLGLTDSARQDDLAIIDSNSQVLEYVALANQQAYLPEHSLQWHATELLESGGLRERALLDRVLELAYPRPYETEVKAAAREFSIPAGLIWAVMKKESNFRADSVSWAGAQGLMQVMPATARWLDDKYGLGIGSQDLTQPALNIRLGAAYLAALSEIFGKGDIRGIIHAYNGGDGNLRKWRERYGSDQLLLTELVPNEENETFSKKVIRYYKIYEWLGAS